jgi:hypothetical protein
MHWLMLYPGNMLANGAVERPRLVNLDQAAAYLGMTTDAVRSKALMGQMPAVKIDKKWRFIELIWIAG